ncbi:K(+)-transporting ATPase subunit C [Pirellulaceae bacterium SH449]
MSDLMTSLRLVMFSLIVCSGIYPMVILVFSMILAPEGRQGSLIRDDGGNIVGSRLLAQEFKRPEYFWPRPSAADYDASETGGSNYSPTNPVLTESAREIIERLNLETDRLVPADLVSASGSGMDPHITLAAALAQVPRVAANRGLSPDQIEQSIRAHLDSPTLVAFGAEPLVNVLMLNWSLDNNK